MGIKSGSIAPNHLQRFGLILFAVALLSSILSFALAPVPLSLDGASHIYNAQEMRRWILGDPFARQVFLLNSAFTPNWLASLVAAAIAVLGTGRAGLPEMNILLAISILAALIYLLRKTGGVALAMLAALTPLAVNIFILVSFWGFILSAALCTFAVAKLEEDDSWHRRVGAFLLVMLAYWAHPLPVLLTSVVPLGLRPLSLRRLVWNTLPWLIADGFVFAFAERLAGGSVQGMALAGTIVNRLVDLSTLHALRELSPSSAVSIPFVGYAGLLVYGAFTGDRSKSRLRSALRVFVVAMFLFYLVCPDRVGNGSAIPQRVLWMAILISGVLAINSKVADDTLYRTGMASVAAIITVVFAWQYFVLSRSVRFAVEEVEAAMSGLPKHSRVLMLSYRLTPDCDRDFILNATQPERHAAMLGAARYELLVVNDYEPATHHFPLVYRTEAYAPLVDEFRFTPVDSDIWRMTLQNAPPVDFVVSWGVPNGTGNCGPAVLAPLTEELRRIYDLRFERQAHSRVQVWARR